MSNDELSLDDMRSALAKWLAGLDGRQQNKRNIAGLLEAAFQRIDAIKTRVEVLDVAFANSHQLNESLGDENRALRARVEAAEAEAARLRDGLAAMSERVTLAQRSASLAENALGTARSRWEEAERREKSIFDSAMGLADQRDSLAARVAELEATLDAQQWRPVTNEPIEDEYYLTYDALLPGNEPWIVNYYSRTQGWANCCSAWLCPPPKPPRPPGDGVTPSK